MSRNQRHIFWAKKNQSNLKSFWTSRCKINTTNYQWQGISGFYRCRIWRCHLPIIVCFDFMHISQHKFQQIYYIENSTNIDYIKTRYFFKLKLKRIITILPPCVCVVCVCLCVCVCVCVCVCYYTSMDKNITQLKMKKIILFNYS